MLKENVKKILYFNSSLLKGGTDVYMMEIIRNINKNKYSVDVLIKDGDQYDESFYDELRSLGSNVFLAKGSFFDRLKYIKYFFKKNISKYDVIHINATSCATGLIAYFAKKYGKIKKVIFHSHMGGNDHRFSIADRIGRSLLAKNVDIYAACSNVAADFMFGNKILKNKKCIILKNSIDVDKFDFDKRIRTVMRKRYGVLDTQFVLLHVGRFVKQKNHRYLIEVFKELASNDVEDCCRLFLIGDGPLKEQIKKLVYDMSLEDKVVFCGLCDNVSDYMQLADCFIMPSVHEGLPIVAVEAQAAGLPCVLSSNISKETQIVADNVCFVDIINDNINDWVTKICEKRFYIRKSTKSVLTEKGFDSKNAIKELEKLYLN